MPPTVGGALAPRDPAPDRPNWPRAGATGLGFRRVADDDLPFLQRVYASTREDELAMIDWSAEQKASFVDMQFRAQDAHYRRHYADMDWLIISAGDVDVGRLYLMRDRDELRIVDIALLTAHRRRSFGGAILLDLLDEAAATGRRVTIHVEKFNPAMRLYQRLGFVKVDDRGVYDLMRWTANDQAGDDQAETDQVKTAS